MRSRVALEGWGCRLLDRQRPDGQWGDGCHHAILVVEHRHAGVPATVSPVSQITLEELSTRGPESTGFESLHPLATMRVSRRFLFWRDKNVTTRKGGTLPKPFQLSTGVGATKPRISAACARRNFVLAFDRTEARPLLRLVHTLLS
jgi:hypothetical protein